MKTPKTPRQTGLASILFVLAGVALLDASQPQHQPRTRVTIVGDSFHINGEVSMKGRRLGEVSLEGLLPNARLVQGVFDDLNPATQQKWAYPDTGKWSADRNTDEFVAAMPAWRRHGLLAFTINLQGGSPTGYGNQGWINPGFEADGTPLPGYLRRLGRILRKADELGMAVILGVFYFGQDEHLRDEAAVIAAVDNTVDWVLAQDFRNVLIEINNECDIPAYDHAILKPDRVHELIERAKTRKRNGRRLYVSTSYKGNTLPGAKVAAASDFLLLHGNSVKEPARIIEMTELTRAMAPGKPILFNEDDHYDFDQPVNHLLNAFRSRASWGYFDWRAVKGVRNSAVNETFEYGFQSVPVDWSIGSPRKKEFFRVIAELSGLKPY